MCTEPHNNPMIVEKKKYIGVGGNLFVIAVDRSEQLGYEGAMTGKVADKELVCDYEWIDDEL